MLNGLDLFSGIGGLAIALKPWVEAVAYCECDRYAQSVLMQRMRSGDLDEAPIWDDVRTLHGERLEIPIDIIYGGFPCQDLSAAGAGHGLAGERSGLYFELERLIRETRPAFVFLENVPAIRTRGLGRVVWGLSELGYDCRWTVVSAQEVGAPHLRKRWFLLAHANGSGLWFKSGRSDGADRSKAFESEYDGANVADSEGIGWEKGRSELRVRGWQAADASGGSALGNANVERSQGPKNTEATWKALAEHRHSSKREWPSWLPEPALCRGHHGLSARVDRLRGLGNAVVPLQAREAFKRLIGIEGG